MNRKNIMVTKCGRKPVEELEIEMVERKGLGHPDSVADGIAESMSRELSKMYLAMYGEILHHNTDQVEIVSGESRPGFRGGVIIKPAYILLSGRATSNVNGQRLPCRTLAVKAANEYLMRFKHLKVEEDVEIDYRIGGSSVDLKAIFEEKGKLANDTSFGVSHAPLSDTERITLEMDRYIHGDLKKNVRGVGDDVKIMSVRKGDKIDITVAAAMIGKEIDDMDHYTSAVNEIRERVLDSAVKLTNREINVYVNTADRPNQPYLTVTGLSMECFDDGSVGRGNRVNGLITPNRPMSLEAAAGKNPVTHVGKLYNILANKIANEIVEESGNDIREAYVRILSQIGKPINSPQIVSIELIPSGINFEKKNAERIADEWLANIEKITEMCVNGTVAVF